MVFNNNVRQDGLFTEWPPISLVKQARLRASLLLLNSNSSSTTTVKTEEFRFSWLGWVGSSGYTPSRSRLMVGFTLSVGSLPSFGLSHNFVSQCSFYLIQIKIVFFGTVAEFGGDITSRPSLRAEHVNIFSHFILDGRYPTNRDGQIRARRTRCLTFRLRQAN